MTIIIILNILMHVNINKMLFSRILIAEAFEEVKDVMRYYGDVNDKVADFPFNFELYKVKATDTAIALFEKIDVWLKNMPKGKYPNWVVCIICIIFPSNIFFLLSLITFSYTDYQR